MKYCAIILLAFLVVSCNNEPKVEALTAEAIVNKSIEVSGGKAFDNSMIQFDFRDNYYSAYRQNGKFGLTRAIGNDSITFIDTLTNDGFIRRLFSDKEGDKKVVLADSMVVKYTASVNSVHYFSVLPYGLNDSAVNKTLLGEEQIKTKDYYKIKVDFNQEGGGEDYEDVFVYWFNKQTFKADYIAYSYNEEDGVGMRFREAYNERYINGLRFVDYNNYKSENEKITLIDLGKSFDKNELKLLSKIELENVKVDLINY